MHPARTCDEVCDFPERRLSGTLTQTANRARIIKEKYQVSKGLLGLLSIEHYLSLGVNIAALFLSLLAVGHLGQLI